MCSCYYMLIGYYDECLNKKKGKMVERDAQGPSVRLGGKMVEQDAQGPSGRLGGINYIIGVWMIEMCFCYELFLNVL